MKRIMIISNHHLYTYNFRKEIIAAFLERGYRVHIVLPYGDKVRDLIAMGCEFTDVELDRRGTNILKELRLLNSYYRIIKKVQPHYIFTYTIKPNLYGGMIGRFLEKATIPNITGLGSGNDRGSLKGLLSLLYKLSFNQARHIFFQNHSNYEAIKKLGVRINSFSILPGSGVNLDEHNYLTYPPSSENVDFLFIGRIMEEKGIVELSDAASIIKSKYNFVNFKVIGFCEDYFKKEFDEILESNSLEYLGFQESPQKFIRDTHAIILPTHSEGMSNVLLEASANGRPVLASNIPGCQEIVEDEETGFLFEVKNVNSIVMKIEQFLAMDNNAKEIMGKKAREKVKKDFSRDLIVNEYLALLK